MKKWSTVTTFVVFFFSGFLRVWAFNLKTLLKYLWFLRWLSVGMFFFFLGTVGTGFTSVAPSIPRICRLWLQFWYIRKWLITVPATETVIMQEIYFTFHQTWSPVNCDCGLVILIHLLLLSTKILIFEEFPLTDDPQFYRSPFLKT